MQFVVVEVGNEQKEKSKQILYTDYLWSRHIWNTYLGRKTELKKLYLVVVLDIAGIENKEIYRPQVFLAAQDLRSALRFISLYYAFAARLLGEQHMHPLQRNQNRKNTTELSIMMKWVNQKSTIACRSIYNNFLQSTNRCINNINTFLPN